MATAATRRTVGSSGAPTQSMSLADINSRGAGLPNRYILHGLEKWGKTSFGAMAPKPVFLMTGGETGLLTLIDEGLLPETPHFPECKTWADLLSAIRALTNDDHEYKTCVIDTLNGAEAQCHQAVCDRDFNGDWTNKGFLNYKAGYEVSLSDWRTLLSCLDTLRSTRKMAILCLCHTKIVTFKNPEGPDYDRYQPEMHKLTWGLSHKWADAIFFGNFETFVDEEDSSKKGKARGSQTRLLYTEHHAAYDAGSRLGLPNEIDMGNNATEAWANFTAARKAARNDRKENGGEK